MHQDAWACTFTRFHLLCVLLGFDFFFFVEFVLEFPIDFFGVRPEFFELVVIACVAIEHVNQHIAVVLDNPFARIVPFHTDAVVTNGTHGGIDFFNNRMHLAPTDAGGQHEVIEHRRQAAKVEDVNVLAFVVGSRLGCKTGPLNGGCQFRLWVNGNNGAERSGHRSWDGDAAQVTSLRVLPPGVVDAESNQWLMPMLS